MPVLQRPDPVPQLNWEPKRARRLGEEAVGLWEEFLGRLPDLPIDRGLDQEQVAGGVLMDVPEEGLADEDLLEHVRKVVFDYSMYPGHPGFMGYISGAGTIPGVVADFIAAMLNQNVGGWRLGPAANEIETHLISWFARRFGLPEGAGGLIVSGGALANFVGLKAAREAKSGWDVRTEGVSAGDPLVLYASAEAHDVNTRGADMLGLGTQAVRTIPTDENYRMQVDALEAAVRSDIESGMRPIAVVASAGTVATGAVDPLPDIADLCERFGLWLHVDAAYGGPAILSDELAPLLTGIERADSIAFDPHKWLYTPHSGGCVLVRDRQTLLDAFSIHPAYTREDKDRTGHGIDMYELGPQFSRSFWAFKIWMSLLAHGRAAYGKRIAHDVELAKYLADIVDQRPDLELMAPVTLSICCFRYVPQDLGEGGGREEYLDELNERLMTEVQLDGRTYYSNAVLRGRFCLRPCIVNFRTEAEHIEQLVDVTGEIGQRLDAELRDPSQVFS